MTSHTSPHDALIKTADEEFHQLFVDVTTSFGLPAAPGRIMAELFLVEGPVTMQELSEKTGYSLPTLSRNVRALDGMGIVRRDKRPGSKKSYISIRSKKLLEIMMNIMRIGYEREVKVMLRDLPRIRKGYLAVEERLDEEGATAEEREALRKRLEIVDGMEKDYQLMERFMMLIGRFIIEGEESVG
ncbi:MAG: winged helix-turn-helix transcriptional regulator [Candidatus Undinarchaeales archaeon]|jgi:DNA-binding transcriptional regulator GbsR (MarR family)|nr:winged helix-turn-helix transcriptional regulator [Candidatus Undinarchaeales archaeon]